MTPRGSEPAVLLRGVHKRYGAVHAVQGVDLAIERGEVFGLIGHNGAGKSTLFKMMLGLIAPSEGDICVHGVPVLGRHFREVRRQIGYLPENVVLYDNLSGLETLHFFAKLKGVAQADSTRVLEQVGLSHAASRLVHTYSKGMRQRLGFAQALLGQPQVLFLDEPTTGLDPEAIRAFYATLRSLRDQGVTLILTSHILAELQERVDKLAIMANGKVRALGTVQSLREQVDMPLRVDIDCEVAHAASIRAALAALGLKGEGLDGPQAGGLQATCERHQKMALLSALAALGPQVKDISVIEPSLEDVFFGLGQE